MKKMDSYRAQLQTLQEWDDFLLKESGLPGRRANLELAHAVALEGHEELFRSFLSFDAEQASTNSPEEFLVFCGVLGLGQLLAQGQSEVLPILRVFASDPRWRLREAVAMALQTWGKQAMPQLLQEMFAWSHGSMLEQRAAAAAVCEPALLSHAGHVGQVLFLLDTIMESLHERSERGNDAFKTLRKGLGYCWSVAVAANPSAGKVAMERWFVSRDPDVIWIMKENLKKKRLERMDAAWVMRSRQQLVS